MTRVDAVETGMDQRRNECMSYIPKEMTLANLLVEWLGVSGILWARHIMRGREDGYATQEEHGRRSGSGPRAAA